MTADDLQVCVPTLAPPLAHAIVLAGFCLSLLQILLEDGLHGLCGPSGAADRLCISVQEARRASTLQHRRVRCGGCGGGGHMCLPVLARRLVCDRTFGAYASCPMCSRPTCAVGWATAAMAGGNARGMQHVCTGSPDTYGRPVCDAGDATFRTCFVHVSRMFREIHAGHYARFAPLRYVYVASIEYLHVLI